MSEASTTSAETEPTGHHGGGSSSSTEKKATEKKSTGQNLTEQKERIRALAPRLIVLALLCVGVQVLMGLSYMGAFGKPDAKRAPFIVVSSTQQGAQAIADKLNAIPGDPVVAKVSTNKAWALDEVKKDHVVGVYDFQPSRDGKTPDHLYFGTAQGSSRASLAQDVGRQVAQQGKRQLQTHDIVVAQKEDSRGTASFYLVLAWLVGAYLLPSAMSTVAGTRAETALGARLRLALFVGYAIISGMAGAALALYGLESLRGSFWAISAVGALVVFTVSTFTFGLTSTFGTMGIGLAILLFVVLGNPSAGGAFAYDVLSEPWRSVGPYLPNGAGVDAVRSVAYFGAVDLGRPLTVLGAWTIVGLLMILIVGMKTYRAAASGVSYPEDEAVGAFGEALERKFHIGQKRGPQRTPKHAKKD